MNILVLTNLFPNKQKPHNGIFVKRRICLYKQIGYDPLVLVPTAWFPFYTRFNYRFSGLKETTITDGIKVIYFKYLHIPKIGMLFQPFSMAVSALYVYLFLQERKQIKFIDGHYLYPDGIAVYLLSKLFKLPYILSARGSDVNIIMKIRVPRLMVLIALRNAFKVISVSHRLRSVLLEYYPDRKKILVIPNGVDHGLFYCQPELTEKIPAKKNLKRILMVGNFIPQKGQHLLIEALKEQPCPKYSIIVYFIGSGELKPLILKNSRIGERIRLKILGMIPNERLVNYYNKMDLSCLLSENEGNPNVVLESLACGLPVLATDVGDLKLIINKTNGYIVRDGSTSSIIDGLTYCLNTHWDRKRISQSVNTFSWEATINRIDTVFSDMVNINKIPSG